MVYKYGRYVEFRDEVLRLAKDEKLRRELGVHAYETITKEWNPREAANRLYTFCEGLLNGKVIPQESGPLSIAPVISPKEGYQYTKKEI